MWTKQTNFPVVFALPLQIRTNGDRKLANMKLITFVFSFLLIGTLVGAIPRGPSEVSPEDELVQREKRDILTDFANEIEEESDLPLRSKRSIPWGDVNNISNIIEPLNDQLRNVTFDELIQVLTDLISNSTNNTSSEVEDIIRRILELPILADIINTGAATTGLSSDVVAVAVAIIIRVIVTLPVPPIPNPLIPFPRIGVPRIPRPRPPIFIPPFV